MLTRGATKILVYLLKSETPGCGVPLNNGNSERIKNKDLLSV